MKKNLKKIINTALLIALIAPPLYFAIHAAFPMEKKEFNGLTYYQFLDWQSIAYAQREDQFNVPKDKRGICAGARLLWPIGLGVLSSEFYALSGMIPPLRYVINRNDWRYLPEPGSVSVLNYLPAAWRVYEEANWYYQQNAPHATLPECRIPINPPTPEQFAALKAAQP